MSPETIFNTIMPQKKSKKKTNQQRKQAKVKLVTSPGLDRQAIMYRNLLRDPCGAPMVAPPAAGPSSGLFVRQRYFQPLTTTAVTNKTSQSFVAVLQPAKGVLKYASQSQGWQTLDLEVGLLASTICRSYRCVAACMKWIPTGSVMNRSGLISSGYVLDEVDTTTTVSDATAVDWQMLCAKSISNTGNGEPIEARWVPSGPEDVEFRARGVTYNADTGTVLMVGRDVDYTTGTTAQANGYLEVTIVYEWVPTSGAGIVAPLQVGTKSTMQQVLSTIGNLTQFVLENPIGRAMGRAAMGSAMQRIENSFAGPSLTYR